MAYTIKEVEKMTGVSEHTIRFWAKKGLFPFVERDKNGVRYFSDVDIEYVYAISCFRKTGMSIEDLRHYITLCARGNSTLEERIAMMKAQKQKVKDILKTYSEALDLLDYKLEVYEHRLKEGHAHNAPHDKNYKGYEYFKRLYEKRQKGE